MKLSSFLILLCCVVLFQDCTVQKRRYQKGFYLARSGRHTSPEPSRKFVTREEPAARPVNSPGALPPEPETLVAVSDRSTIQLYSPKKATLTDTCDLIVLSNGEEILGKVLEISTDEVRFRKCSMPDGPVFVQRKSDIFMIRYANGSREVFEKKPAASTGGAPATRGGGQTRTQHPGVSTVLVLTILGWIPFLPTSIAAIVVGNRVQREIRAEPQRYSGEEAVKVCLIFSWIKVAIIIGYIVMIVLLTGLFL
jgi:hypothetical protein